MKKFPERRNLMLGAIAEEFYEIPEDLREQVFDYIDETLQDYYWTYSEQLYNL